MGDARLWRWSQNRGVSSRLQTTVPEDQTLASGDIQLEAGTLGRRRFSLTNIDLTSGPSAVITYLAPYRPSSGTHLLFAFSSTATLAVHSWTGAAWTSQSLGDAADVNPAYPDDATLNNKLFFTYNSAVNRLHCFDGTSIRRVGLSKPSAPTVADTGAPGVALAAIARYYRIQFLIKSGSDIVAMSELSDAVSFTPDGSHTTARITKSTTVDSATHWRIYGLSGAQTDVYDLYEQVGSDTVIGTTTLDDITPNPSSYSGTAPPQLGLNIPPPSAKYLATDNNRLLMAGAYETSGSAGLTTPNPNRVWFTRVLGSSDLGDDESVPNTEDQKNWIDVGSGDGDIINGLSGSIGGSFFVFKSHHIYQLNPTGIDTLPYQAELVSSEVGLLPVYEYAFRSILDVGDVVYFESWAGLYRISPSTGLHFLGWDIGSAVTGLGPNVVSYGYDESFRQIVGVNAANAILYVFNPAFAQQTADGWRGGWVTWTATGFDTPRVALSWEVDGGTNFRYVFLGGSHSGSAKLQVFNSTSVSDAGGTYTPALVSHYHLFDPNRNVSVGDPLLQTTVQASSATVPTVFYVMNYGANTSRSVTGPSLASGAPAHVCARVTGLEGSDTYALSVGLTYHASQVGSIQALVIPAQIQEPR